MRFRVLGTVEAAGADGAPVVLGYRQRALLAALLAHAGEVVPVGRLAELTWAGDPPGDTTAALHSLVSRLRRAVPYARIVTRPPGYVLHTGPDDVDAARFDRLVAAAAKTGGEAAVPLLEEALGLWRGRAYAEFADSEVGRLEAIRLEAEQLHAIESWHQAMLEAGRPAESLPRLAAYVARHRLRERPYAILMRTLYALDRPADALRAYDAYAAHVAGELGLEPTAAMRDLRARIVRREPPAALESPAPDPAPGAPVSLAGLHARPVVDRDGRAIAVASLGSGPPLVVLPGWVSSIEVIGSGRDLRSSLLQRLVGRVRLTLYDRYGTGLSRGAVDDFGLTRSVDELEAVIVRGVGGPVNLLATSQAGPVAVGLAARHPQLVDRIAFLGTYADGRATFTSARLNAALVAMVRTDWALGSTILADLYRPGAGGEAARHLAEVLRDSADREVAAGYLEAMYQVDVTRFLPRVPAPALVLHYRDDRVVPFTGGRQLAVGLPDARLVPLDGRFHLPDVADLDHVATAIADFVGAPL